jgi:glyoxylase-like metal-dependent hydrolase (beta-lactamase superfamily II)
MMSELYEVIIVRHGTLATRRSDVYLNHRFYDELDGPHTVDYYLWVARNESRTVIVDTGFAGVSAASRKRTILLDPLEAYRELGIDPAEPHQVVITHAHYDHIGNLGLFPNSPMVISEAEFKFWEREIATKPLLAHFTEPTDLANLRAIKNQGRLTTFVNSIEIAPGIDVIEVGGHTPGQSMVRVPTREGVVLLASDTVHFREELDRDMPFLSATCLPAVYEGFETIRNMLARGEIDIVVTGHDASALDGFEPLGGVLAGNVAVIGRISR